MTALCSTQTQCSGESIGKGNESMESVNWNAASELHERDDAGSDMFVEFKTLKRGPLAELIDYVVGLPTDQKARLVIDASGIGSLNIHDITNLSKRADFPKL